MASIVNALRNITSDSFWFVKLIFMSIPIFMILNIGILVRFSVNEQIIFYSILGIFYLGVAVILMHRNINNISPILPGPFSILEFVTKGIGMCIISVPMFALYFAAMYAIYTYVILDSYMMLVAYLSVTLFLSPFILVPAVLFSVNGKLSEAFNFSLIIEAAGNFIVAILSFMLQYVFTILLFAYLFYALFTSMVTDPMPVDIVNSFTLVLSILTLYSYCSDLYGDVIPQMKKKRKKGEREDILD